MPLPVQTRVYQREDAGANTFELLVHTDTPSIVHEVAFCDVHESVIDCPAVIVAGEAVRLAETVG